MKTIGYMFFCLVLCCGLLYAAPPETWNTEFFEKDLSDTSIVIVDSDGESFAATVVIRDDNPWAEPLAYLRTYRYSENNDDVYFIDYNQIEESWIKKNLLIKIIPLAPGSRVKPEELQEFFKKLQVETLFGTDVQVFQCTFR